MKIINIYRGFTEYGGAETVLLSIHESLKKLGYKSYVSGPNPFSENHPKYNIAEEEYLRFSLQNLNKFNDAVVFSHHRKMTTFLFQAKILPGLNFRLINVVHSEFFNLKIVTFLPKENIAVSERVRNNLISIFNANPENVKVIYNGLEDHYKNSTGTAVSQGNEPGMIRIFYPGRITKVKRQLEVFEKLQGKLNSNIRIDFAGVGEDYEELVKKTKDSKSFKALGFVSIKDTLQNYDFVMLFSSSEGLPLTLIEGCMFGKPLICNDVGGNFEILEDGYNGFAANTYEQLIDVLNNLPAPQEEAYKKLSLNSRSTYEGKFQKERMIQDYINVIKKTP